MLHLDGATGDGQLLRTALSLSLCTQTPFRMTGIRAGRPRPGLMRQHLTAVDAAVTISGARVEGASLGSEQLSFAPGAPQGGDYRFAIGSAGSTTLVLQTVLPALLQARAPSRLVIEGGTHNPLAPSADFLSASFLPLLRLMGADVQVHLERHGFYPAGGGRLRVDIQPGVLKPIERPTRGALISLSASALTAAIPPGVAGRELAVVQRRLGLAADALQECVLKSSVGPGNVLTVTVQSEFSCNVFTGFGARGVSAEQVASRVCTAVEDFLASPATVDEHLADQLLLPMALAGGGMFSTTRASEHCVSNAQTIQRFLSVDIRFQRDASAAVQVGVVPRQPPRAGPT